LRENISQLIAGYIDIILKKKKAKDHLGIEGDEESTMYEDSVSPAKATIIQHQSSKLGVANTGSVALPAVLRAGDTGDHGAFSEGSLQKAQLPHLSQHAHENGHSLALSGNQNAHIYGGMGQAQRALLGTITEGLETLEQSKIELRDRAQLPPLGNDMASDKWKETTKDMSRQKVGSQLSAMNAATAQMVTLTSAGPDDTDYTAVGSAVQTISSNMGEFSKDVKMLAALEEEESDNEKLLDAARRLANAFSDLLKAAQPGSTEPRQTLLNAATKVGEASHDVMLRVEPDSDADSAYKDMLIALAKAVANATATLVLKAKGVSAMCDNQQDQNRVIGSATQCALATSQLVACTKVVAPTIRSPECQEQLVEAAKQVAKSVDGVVDNAQDTSADDASLRDLGTAATAVTKALDDLMKHIKRGAGHGTEVDGVDSILVATDRLFSSMGDTPEMIRQAQILAQATAQLVIALKGQADSQSDTEQQQRLLAAAKQLADATTRMVEAAKGCASTPQDRNQQNALRLAAEDLRTVTSLTATSTLKIQLMSALQQAAKNAASAATQLINAAGSAGKSNRNQASQQQLMTHCKAVADDVIPRLVQGLRANVQNPENANAQMNLIQAALGMMQPCGKMLSSAKAAVPTVGDQSAALSLSNASKNLATALAELRGTALKAQDACVSMEIDVALEQVRALEQELVETRRTAAAGRLVPLPGDNANECAMQLGATSKIVGSSMAQLLTAASQGDENYTGRAAKDTANALRTLTTSVRGIAATTNDRELQESIIEHARDVMDKSASLIEEAKKAVNNPQNPDNQARLAQVAKAVSQALNNCVNCLPGLREVDQAIKHITTINTRLSHPQQFPTSGRSFQEVQQLLSSRAADLNQATTDIMTACQSSVGQVGATSNRFSRAYEDFVEAALEMAGKTKDPEVQNQIVTGLRSVSMVSIRFLMATKSLLVDPNAPNARNQLSQSARSVTDSINHMINTCTVSAPGQKECDNALRQIQMMRPLLDNPSEPIVDGNYFDCLDGVIDKSKALAESMTGISSHAKQSELNDFCVSVASFANAVCGMIENTAHAAYLVGISDPASEPGRAGLVDQSQFARAMQSIQVACQSLANPTSTQQQVLSAATSIAKHTSALCNTCRVASAKTDNPVAKRHFVQSAKDVANSTANLVRAIKVLDSDFTDDNRRQCTEAARPLLQAVEVLTTFACSPEFASVPARISDKARKAQEPITTAGRSIIDGACNMLMAAKQLAMNPKDPPTYQAYSTHSHSVSEAIKRLVSSIREAAPGHRECDSAIQRTERLIQDLDQAALSAASGKPMHADGSLQSYQEMLINSARQLLEHIDPIRNAAKGEAESLGHLITSAATYLEPLRTGAIGCAAKTLNSRIQMALLDQSKTVIESMQNLFVSAKESGGNSRATNAHAAVDETADTAREMLLELIQTLEDTASASGLTNVLIDNITKAITKTDDRTPVGDDRSFADYQTNIIRLAKQIALTTQDMMGKSVTNVQDLGTLANMLTRDYCALANESRGIVDASSNPQLGGRIKTAVQQLGNGCIDLVKDAGQLQCHPNDNFTKRDLNDHGRKVLEYVSNLLSALQSGARGTQACVNAASTVSGIIGDLDTTIMFATAGTLNADLDESFADHRENILKTAKALVEDTKTLVAGAASNQEQLAGAAQSAVITITRLAECVKYGAASLGSSQPEAQVLLINAVKDVASALADLISATKNASGKSAQDISMSRLKDTAKMMVTNVTSLLKTVKTVEDETARGTQALESSIEAIGQELRSYAATDRVERQITPDELVRLTKPITIATARAVAAGNSCRQEDVISAANMGRKAVYDLLTGCKGGVVGLDDHILKRRVLESGNQCGTAYKDLLEQINVILQRPNFDNKQKLSSISRRVASAVTEIVQSAEAIKEYRGDRSSSTDWIDPHDPTAIAETELLSAANSIEAAARKLSQLQPRQRPKQADDSLNFEEQILDAAKSIAAATAALVKAASAAQRELTMQGKIGVSASDLDEDSQWSQGLISAARLVAAATHSLCDAANAMVQGQASEEKLISSAKQVASSTAQLLVACKVKADPNSVAMQRLQNAGNAVKRATEALVREAQSGKEWSYEENEVTVDQRMVSGMAQLIQAQEEILIKERQLETARKKLETIRKAKYKDRPSDIESTDSGTDF